MDVTDLTGYIWVGNETLSSSSPPFEYDLLFTNSSNNYTKLINPYDISQDGFFYNELRVYRRDSWGSEDYRTIDITGGTDATNTELISWLEANGTLTPTQTNISIDLTTLSGWSSLSAGTHSITVKAKATGYRDSEASQAVTVTKAQWTTPTITLAGSVLSTPIVEGVTKYKVYSNGTYIGYIDDDNIWHGEVSE